MSKNIFLKQFSVAQTATRLVLALFLLSQGSANAAQKDVGNALKRQASSGAAIQGKNSAQLAFRNGNFVVAGNQWREAAQKFGVKGDSQNQVLALANAGTAYQAAGQPDVALVVLREALPIATRNNHRAALSLIQNTLGSLYTFSRQPLLAEAALRAGLQIAETDKDNLTAARVLNNLGNLLAIQDNDAAARDYYRRSAALATTVGDKSLQARAELNEASLLLGTDQASGALSLSDAAAQSLQTLDDSHDKAQLLLSAARIYRVLYSDSQGAAPDNSLLERAETLNNTASQVATRLKSPRLLSLSLGALGEINETRGQFENAALLTRRARFIAQGNQFPDLHYQWDWQMGRLLQAQGDREGAISALRRAIETLRTLGDCDGLLALDPHSAFRDSAGPLYYQMADLLLKRTDALSDPQAIQKGLIEARDTVELLKTAEIGDYFQDACVTAGLSKVKEIESVLQDTAVVYYIPLPDRLEVLLGLTSGLKRFTVPLKSSALTARVRRFRLQLERPGTSQYLSTAQSLYDVLIRPIEAELAAQKIKTLVFVSDGALRTIPMGALSDGKQFVIQKFGVALTPGLTLMDPRSLSPGEAQVFAGGVSEAVQGFEALASVPAELQHIDQNFAAKTQLNQEFRKASIERNLTDGQYSIVHLASHGEFSSNPAQTYLLTYDGKLTMDDLENMIRPHQFQGRPVEMLVLSACQTASGDDRAALGLAGAALKSGARSVMASLWSVSDEATAQLVKNFYIELKRDPTQSKAIALQKAQVELLNDERFAHPGFWAPYIVVGNWL